MRVENKADIEHFEYLFLEAYMLKISNINIFIINTYTYVYISYSSMNTHVRVFYKSDCTFCKHSIYFITLA